ncbi:hypothetical protein [Haloimpatiens lingqiaonensis]|uniref:hypothetical protein n=1 Tax=Haloimpatiens lingqiaonensis TaxID=1380675 RepID=UPI0010FDD01F|nr:hypothetical protein [Haloimpatiens lingqiaonensis]
MKRTGRLLSTTLVLIIALNISACSKSNTNKNNSQNTPEVSIDIGSIKFPNVTILCRKSDYNQLFSINGDTLDKIGKIPTEDILDLIYSKEKDVYIFLVKKIDKNGKIANQIKIKKGNNTKILNESSIYADIKISPNNNNILFRSFKDANMNMPEGIRIYNIDEDKEIKIKTKVLVSGNVYQWLDDENIIYYGIISDKPNSGHIYKYNIKSGEESVYLDKLEGLCCNIYSISKDEILVLDNREDEYKLTYYNVKTGDKKLICKNISDMTAVVQNKDKKLLYFIGESLQSGGYSLFSIDLNTFECSQLTYDLPKNVDKLGGLALDPKGNVIFAGKDSEDKNDIYIYDTKNNSTSLITNSSNNYKIYKNN